MTNNEKLSEISKKISGGHIVLYLDPSTVKTGFLIDDMTGGELFNGFITIEEHEDDRVFPNYIYMAWEIQDFINELCITHVFYEKPDSHTNMHTTHILGSLRGAIELICRTIGIDFELLSNKEYRKWQKEKVSELPNNEDIYIKKKDGTIGKRIDTKYASMRIALAWGLEHNKVFDLSSDKTEIEDNSDAIGLFIFENEVRNGKWVVQPTIKKN